MFGEIAIAVVIVAVSVWIGKCIHYGRTQFRVGQRLTRYTN